MTPNFGFSIHLPSIPPTTHLGMRNSHLCINSQPIRAMRPAYIGANQLPCPPTCRFNLPRHTDIQRCSTITTRLG
jgi:hypothetical protein